jgi:hypothetical protein
MKSQGRGGVLRQQSQKGRVVIMAMPQQDDYIEQIHRLEGLMAYAEAHQDWEELERLKDRLRKLLERV